ncbi:MAG: Arylmalonate decarboxylase [Homoserinimonas sp.]|nr:Arylmalonate decarboxylase [Homoserinimonas sp.]
MLDILTNGWRVRIGLILPADNVLIEPELYAVDLPGVSFHTLRLTTTDHVAMRRQGVELAKSIRELGLDVVVYACAETSFNGGSGVRETLSELIAAECGLPVVTATNAMLTALKAMAVQRIAVVTPYKDESGRAFERTMREAGLTVVAAVHRDFSRESTDAREWFMTNRQPASTAYSMARALDAQDAEAIVIASTNFATLAMIGQLERDAKKPVVSSNQSILWWCLKTLDIDAAGLNLGSLLELPLGAPTPSVMEALR